MTIHLHLFTVEAHYVFSQTDGTILLSVQVIDIEAELTTNHKGWMEVNLCPNDDPDLIIEESCLEQYVICFKYDENFTYYLTEREVI